MPKCFVSDLENNFFLSASSNQIHLLFTWNSAQEQTIEQVEVGAREVVTSDSVLDTWSL